MARQTYTQHRLAGASVFERLKATGGPVPSLLKKPLATFKKAHAALDAVSKQVELARVKRDEALVAIGAADTALDGNVRKLADALVGAGIGTRIRPFATLSPLTPSAMTELAYAKEVNAVRSLLAKIERKKNFARSSSLLQSCSRSADAVEKALNALTRPQAHYQKALAERDALLVDWTKAFNQLKKYAAVAWDDDGATVKVLFAAPQAIQAPKKKQARKAKPVKAPPTDPGHV